MSADEELLLADSRARSEALDPRRSFIVQAPAGSGKTELLIQRYLTLLGRVENPEEVLAITFTKKAAAEMQHRVLQALTTAREGEEPAADYLRVTYKAARRVLERDAASGWQLMDSPGRMRIQTMDALNARLSRTLPMSSGLGGQVPTLADAEMDSIYRAAAVALIDDWLLVPGKTRGALENLLRHLDNNTGLFISYLAAMLAKRDQWLELIGGGRLTDAEASLVRRRLENTIRDLIQSHLGSLLAACPAAMLTDLPELAVYAGTNLAGKNGESPLSSGLLACARFPDGHPDSIERWRALAQLLLTKQGMWRKAKGLNAGSGFPPGDAGQKQALGDLLEQLGEEDELRELLFATLDLPPPRYEEEQWKVLLSLFELLPTAVAELRALFAVRGVTDHIEVALAASKALGSVDEPGELALLMDYKVSHLLIDEMQDTSLAQYELVERLTAGWEPADGRTLFCVGDPMQSIYRFRNAEVGQFLLAQTGGIGSVQMEQLILRRNFRSGEHLVHWFNDTFTRTFPQSHDVLQGAIGYEASVPVEMHGGEGKLAIHPLYDADRGVEANCGLNVIKEALEQGSPSVAVLVRSRTQLPELLYRLRVAGIDYQAIEIDRLTDLPEIIDVLALARALAHADDRIAWLGVLRGPWVGLDWNDVFTLLGNAKGTGIRELLSDPARQEGLSSSGRQAIAGLLGALGEQLHPRGEESFRDFLERAWFRLGGPAIYPDVDCIDNIYRFFAVIEKLESAGTIPDISLLEDRLDQERVSGSAKPGCRLQIMTMHKAKGLQFDTVILYGLGRSTRNSDAPVMNWLSLPEQEGERELVISPVGPRSQMEKDPLHKFISSIEKRKETLELDRLLYVACTRAEKQLHLIGHVKVAADGERLLCESGSLLKCLWPTIESTYQEHFAGNGNSEPGDEERTLVEPILRRLQPTWQLPATPIMPGPPAEPERSLEEQQLDYYWVGSYAPHVGTVVHRWLQYIAEGRIPADPGEIAALHETSMQWLDILGVQANEMAAACKRVEQALHGALGDARGQWLLAGEGQTELALTGLVNGRIESVVIDRIRIDEDGTHWLVDYKTSSHEGGDLGQFIEQEQDRYRSQLAKYSFLYSQFAGVRPRTALYFPLLGEFSEVTGT